MFSSPQKGVLKRPQELNSILHKLKNIVPVPSLFLSQGDKKQTNKGKKHKVRVEQECKY